MKIDSVKESHTTIVFPGAEDRGSLQKSVEG
jgi:hypothetical protein